MDIHKKHVIISCTLLFLGIIFPFTISAQKSFKNSFQDLDQLFHILIECVFGIQTNIDFIPVAYIEL